MLLYITYQREANPSSLYTNLNACHIPEYLPLETPCKRQRKKSCSLEDDLRIKNTRFMWVFFLLGWPSKKVWEFRVYKLKSIGKVMYARVILTSIEQSTIYNEHHSGISHKRVLWSKLNLMQPTNTKCTILILQW